MSTIYLLRHAESEFNAAWWKPNRSSYYQDSDLSSRGEEQASELTGDYDVVMCSPMRRTRRTLQLSKIKYGQLTILEEAREVKHKRSDFKMGEDIVKETPQQIQDRVERLWSILQQEAGTGRKILVVTHSKIIRLLKEKEAPEITPKKAKNAEICELQL